MDDPEILTASDDTNLDQVGPDRLALVAELADERRSHFRSYLDDPE